MRIALHDFMDSPEGWGRAQGREVYQRLLSHVEGHSGTIVFRISLAGVRRVDISFASETVVEVARRYRGTKGFCFLDLDNPDMVENWDAAAARKEQPLMSWRGEDVTVIGPEPSQGNREALLFALARNRVRASEFAEIKPGMSIANASNKYKQLAEQGFLLRRESAADTGGIEYVYQRIV